MTENLEKKPRGVKLFASYLPVKIISVLGILFFAAMIIAGTALCGTFWNEGFYEGRFDSVVNDRFENIARLNANMIASYVQGKEVDEATEFILDRNIAAVKIFYVAYPYDCDGNKLDSFELYRSEKYKENLPKKYVCRGYNGDIEWTIYILPELTQDDAYLSTYKTTQRLYEMRYVVIALTGICAFFLLINLIIFLIGIGRRPEKDEVSPNIVTKIPFDVFTVLIGFACAILSMVVYEASISSMETVGVFFLGVIFILAFIWLADLVLRIKLRNVFSYTVCWMLIKLIWKLVCNISLIWQALIVLTIAAFIEFCFIVFVGLAGREMTALVILFFWFVEKCFTIPVLLYIVFMTKNLFKGGNEIASGNLDYKINMIGLFGAYKKHGQTLNNLSEVINKSVSEQLKSERMKTELVTNVSHDLKTPLTSVINYSDLIQTEAKKLAGDLNDRTTDNNDNANNHLANIEEYSNVLNRQSNKLKRLLEDLVDISKANSGNMEVNIEKINVSTILSQAVGEYEERFEEKNLDAILNIPAEDLYVNADSRKLWRVFDNLLQNIYKYALPSTRVFLEAKQEDEKVNIIFKNTSKDIITISPDELTERFTRNDDSRHMEGNGLGLAIAKTMTDLQGGKFKLDVDGDLFKATVTLDKAIIEDNQDNQDNQDKQDNQVNQTI